MVIVFIIFHIPHTIGTISPAKKWNQKKTRSVVKMVMSSTILQASHVLLRLCGYCHSPTYNKEQQHEDMQTHRVVYFRWYTDY